MLEQSKKRVDLVDQVGTHLTGQKLRVGQRPSLTAVVGCYCCSPTTTARHFQTYQRRGRGQGEKQAATLPVTLASVSI